MTITWSLSTIFTFMVIALEEMVNRAEGALVQSMAFTVPRTNTGAPHFTAVDAGSEGVAAGELAEVKAFEPSRCLRKTSDGFS